MVMHSIGETASINEVIDHMVTEFLLGLYTIPEGVAYIAMLKQILNDKQHEKTLKEYCKHFLQFEEDLSEYIRKISSHKNPEYIEEFINKVFEKLREELKKEKNPNYKFTEIRDWEYAELAYMLINSLRLVIGD